VVLGAQHHRPVGDGTTATRTAPTQVGTLATWQADDAGKGHTVGLKQP
jgi:hypothetical protein